MSLKVYDFKCENKSCPIRKKAKGDFILRDVLVDIDKEGIPKCPHCEKEMVKVVGTIWPTHASWSRWRI